MLDHCLTATGQFACVDHASCQMRREPIGIDELPALPPADEEDTVPAA